jgi:hypothetical protein
MREEERESAHERAREPNDLGSPPSSKTLDSIYWRDEVF